MSAEFEAKMKSLSPEDRKAVKDGFAYRLDFPGDKVVYARSLQDAIDKRRVKPGEAQAMLTALPWERKPTG